MKSFRAPWYGKLIKKKQSKLLCKTGKFLNNLTYKPESREEDNGGSSIKNRDDHNGNHKLDVISHKVDNVSPAHQFYGSIWN